MQRHRLVALAGLLVATGALVTDLCASGRAASAISGPWMAGDLKGGVRYRVVPLPRACGRTGHRRR